MLCHPGPIATRAAGQMRSLYGSSGLLQVSDDEKEVKRRQSPERVAELILKACYHGAGSCWISKHPVLLMGEAQSTHELPACSCTKVPGGYSAALSRVQNVQL